MTVTPGKQADFVEFLPPHLTQQVLSHLDDPQDLVSAGSVCSKWRQAVNDEALWQQSYERRFPAWCAERTLRGGSEWRQHSSWPARYCWRHTLDSRWRHGRKQLEEVLDNHASWVNAVRLLPGGRGVASGGSEGAVNLWTLDGQLRMHNAQHSAGIWALDVAGDKLVSGGMDGIVQVIELEGLATVARIGPQWRTAAAPGGRVAPTVMVAHSRSVVTSVQLLPCGQQLLAGYMDGAAALFDLRCGHAAPGQHGLGLPPTHFTPSLAFQWQSPRPRVATGLYAVRCHEHLVAAGGAGAVVTLHDMRMGGARYAELVPPVDPHAITFAMDLQHPRLATAQDDSHIQVWDLSRLDGAAAEEAGERCLLASNHMEHSGDRNRAVFCVRLLEDWRLLTADEEGSVRLWDASSPDICTECDPVDTAHSMCSRQLPLVQCFAPSLDAPVAELADAGGGPDGPVSMHAVDACLTHLVVAGRDSVVRLYSFEP